MKIGAEDGRGKRVGVLEVGEVEFANPTPEFEFLTLTWKSKKGTKTWTHGLRVRILTQDNKKSAILHWKARQQLARAKLLLPAEF